MATNPGAKTIEPPNPRWASIFRTEAGALADCFGPISVDLHHIGSTAVPDIFAKPIVDILLVAEDLDTIDAAAPAVAALGYEARGAYGIEGRRYFARLDFTGALRGFHVHGFARGHPYVARYLRFRDFLIARPDIADAYSRLKQSIAGPSGVLPPDYQALKAGFVADVRAAALKADSGA
jgi:GrpB-like predicted nucleotidyltransferase (UPF0157 family)